MTDTTQKIEEFLNEIWIDDEGNWWYGEGEKLLAKHQLNNLMVEARIDELERILEASEQGKDWAGEMAHAVGQVGRRYQELKATLKENG